MHITVRKEDSFDQVRLNLLDRMSDNGSQHLIFQNSMGVEVVVIEISTEFKVVDWNGVVFDYWEVLDNLAKQLSEVTTIKVNVHYAFVDDVHETWFLEELNRYFTSSTSFTYKRSDESNVEQLFDGIKENLEKACTHRAKKLKGKVILKIYNNGLEASEIKILENIDMKKMKKRTLHALFT